MNLLKKLTAVLMSAALFVSGITFAAAADSAPVLGGEAKCVGVSSPYTSIKSGDFVSIITTTSIAVSNYDNLAADYSDDQIIAMASADVTDISVNANESFAYYNSLSESSKEFSVSNKNLIITTTFKNVKYLGKGNTFSYKVKYISEGGEEIDKTFNYFIGSCVESEEEKEATNLTVILNSNSTYTLKAGTSTYLNFGFNTFGTGEVNRVTASLSSSDSSVIVNETGEKVSYSANPSFSFGVRVPDGTAQGIYNLSLSVTVYGDNGYKNNASYTVPVYVTNSVNSAGLTIESYNVSKDKVKEGDKFDITLVLKNKCGTDLKNISVSLNIPDANVFALNGGFSKQSLDIRNNSTGTVKFSLIAGKGIKNVREAVGIKAVYRTDPAKAETEQSLDTSVIVSCIPAEEAAGLKKYDLTVTDYSVSRNDIENGTPFTLKVTVNNSSKNKIEKARISIANLDGKKFAIDSGLTFEDFSIDASKSKTFSFNLIGCSEIATTKENITVHLDFGDQSTDSYVTVDCKPTGGKNGKFDLTMTDFSVSRTGIANGTPFSLGVTVTNSSSIAIENARITLTGLDGGKFAVNSGLGYCDFSIDAGSSKTFYFDLIGCKGIASIREVLTVHLDFGEQSTDSYATVDCIPEEKSNDPEEQKVFAPNIIIENYSFGGNYVTAGKTFPLEIKLKNVSNVSDIENLKVTISGGASTDGKIAFSPSNSTNSFFFEKLPSQDSVDISIEFLSKADADPNSYPITITFGYEYSNGGKHYQASEHTETINIPLQQEDRFSINDLDYPNYPVYVGDSIQISSKLLNMGKSSTYNVMASVSGEGFTASETSFFIGNINSGSEEYYDVQITPNMSGEINGEVVFTYEDANGSMKEQRKYFVLNVNEMFYNDSPVDFEPEMPEETTDNTWIWFVIGGAVAAVIIVIVIVACVKKAKVRKLQRELEEDDENI